MTDDVIHSTQYYMKYINRAILVNLHHKPVRLCRLTVLQKHSVPMAHPFPDHPLDFNILVIFSSKNIKRDLKLELTYALLNHAYQAL